MSDESHWKRKCMVICLLALFIGLIGIVLPEIVFTPKIYINASNITAVGASSTSGGIANISEINNGNYSLVESTTPWYVNITFTNITNFSYLETKSMYFATTGAPSAHEVDIEIWCETEGEFVDLYSLTSHLEWTYFTRNFPDSMHFIDPAGNVTVRFNHSDNGNTQHRLYIDTTRLITSTQFEQSTIYLNQTTNNTYINQTDIAFVTVVNNTNLAPTQVGVPGTGERVSGTDYFANTSEIQILLWSFTDNAGEFGDIYLFINDTMVVATDHNENPVGGKLNSSIIAHIPKYSKYKAVFLSMERYEWREYPILSGRNGTLSINQTIIHQGGGVSFDGSVVDLNGSTLKNGTFNGTETQNLSQVLAQGNDANNYGILNLNNISGSGSKKQTTIINTSFNMNRTIDWADSNLISDGMMVTRNNGNITSVFRDMGAQFWYLHYGSASSGYAAGDFGGAIGYSTPSNGIGFSLRNSTPGINQTVWTSQWRHDLFFVIDSASGQYFLCVAPGNQTTAPTCKLKIYANGNITHPALVGAGNAYLCIDSTGTEFRGNPGC